METPLGFAGFNFTMVQQRCTIPIRGFRWDYSGERENTVVVDRGDIDRDYPWIPNERLQPWNSLMFTKFSSASASRWCAACVETVPFDEEDGLTMTDDDTGLTVSIMNKKLLAMTNTKAMAKLDWVALLMSAYVVGLMVSGEIKECVTHLLCRCKRRVSACSSSDILDVCSIVLCEIQAQKNAHKLTAPWQLALEALNCLRSQFFLAPLMGATPAIVVTQGGSALAICFNTIAILVRHKLFGPTLALRTCILSIRLISFSSCGH
jgi:phage terminase large subunit-like protein